MPRSALLTVTCALGTAAPLWSVTVPVMEAESCPNAANVNARKTPNHTARSFIATPWKYLLAACPGARLAKGFIKTYQWLNIAVTRQQVSRKKLRK